MNKNSFWLLITTCLLAFLIGACSVEDNREFREISVSPFEKLSVNGVMEVVLEQGTGHFVRLEGFPWAMNDVDIRSQDGELRIDYKMGGKWLTPQGNKMVVTVGFRDLKVINAYSSASFRSKGKIIGNDLRFVFQGTPRIGEFDLELDLNYFSYWNSHLAGGRMNLSGRVGQMDLYIFSTMSVLAKNLRADSVLIKTWSRGDANLNINNKMVYGIYGAGNILVSGRPGNVILLERKSTGNLIFVD